MRLSTTSGAAHLSTLDTAEGESSTVYRRVPPPFDSHLLEIRYRNTFGLLSCTNRLYFATVDPIDRDVTADVWEGFSSWFVSQGLAGTEESPAAYLPRSFGTGPVLALEAAIKLPLPLAGSVFRVVLNILGELEDAMPPGSAVTLQLFGSAGGRGNRGWQFLGPCHQAMLAGNAAGEIDGVRGYFLQKAWRTLLEAAPLWLEPRYALRPVIRHSKPMAHATMLGGWATAVTDIVVPRGRVTSLSRRTKPPSLAPSRLV